jgi:hypothetical protein
MNSNLKILFVDEQVENFDYIKDYFEGTSNSSVVDLDCVLPLSELEKMIVEILERKPQALIVDHRLNEMREDTDYPIKYNGTTLVQEFLRVKPGFPCFVLTSFEENAQLDGDDVNIVYPKEVLYREKGNFDESFFKKVKRQIEKYERKLTSAENELIRLIDLKRNGKASYEDELKIIKLDSFLEQAIDGRVPIPEEFKKTTNLSKLTSLLEKADELLNIKRGEE